MVTAYVITIQTPSTSRVTVMQVWVANGTCWVLSSTAGDTPLFQSDNYTVCVEWARNATVGLGLP